MKKIAKKKLALRGESIRALGEALVQVRGGRVTGEPPPWSDQPMCTTSCPSYWEGTCGCGVHITDPGYCTVITRNNCQTQ